MRIHKLHKNCYAHRNVLANNGHFGKEHYQHNTSRAALEKREILPKIQLTETKIVAAVKCIRYDVTRLVYCFRYKFLFSSFFLAFANCAPFMSNRVEMKCLCDPSMLIFMKSTIFYFSCYRYAIFMQITNKLKKNRNYIVLLDFVSHGRVKWLK